MKLELVTAPAVSVILPADLMSHCRIDASAEDAYVQQLIDMAQEAVEHDTWRKLVTQTWDQFSDEFDDPLYLRYPPLASVTSVTYTDSDGDSQTLATSVYEVGEEDGIAVVRRKYNQSWPDTRAHEDVVTVRFVCGQTPSAVPEGLKHLVRLMAAWHYRNREGQPEPLDAYHRLLEKFRVGRFLPIGAA